MLFVRLYTHNHSFYDYYDHKVELSFQKDFFSTEAKHVLVLCKQQDKWLMTRHQERGLEFPGGKVEVGETAAEAAIREVYEETGGVVSKLYYIGQYKVQTKQEVIIKNIYYAEVTALEKKDQYFETAGPILMKEIPLNVKKDDHFSFIMKDDVLTYSLQWVKQRFR